MNVCCFSECRTARWTENVCCLRECRTARWTENVCCLRECRTARWMEKTIPAGSTRTEAGTTPITIYKKTLFFVKKKFIGYHSWNVSMQPCNSSTLNFYLMYFQLSGLPSSTVLFIDFSNLSKCARQNYLHYVSATYPHFRNKYMRFVNLNEQKMQNFL